jgi:hypothetical protein
MGAAPARSFAATGLDNVARLAEAEVPGTIGRHLAHVPVADAVRAAVAAHLPASAQGTTARQAGPRRR